MIIHIIIEYRRSGSFNVSALQFLKYYYYVKSIKGIIQNEFETNRFHLEEKEEEGGRTRI